MKFTPRLIFALLLCFSRVVTAPAQTGDHMLYGDLVVDESKVEGVKPLTFDIILYSESGVLVSRQTVSTNGRYRFNNLPRGLYLVAIEVESREVARVSADLRSPLLLDVRRDIELEWRSPTATASKPGVLFAYDLYQRTAVNQKLFRQAIEASNKAELGRAAELLMRITAVDAKDFQAWTELANVHFRQRKYADAENEYLHAIDAEPGFFLALLNLGRLELTLKKYDVAVEVLTRAVKARPNSPDANYFLGESYLRLKKGSLAVPFLNEAVRLDPNGMAEVHLRLAALYDAAHLKDRAAREYEQFLKKRPDYRDRRKLEKYISENRKPRAAA